QDSTQRVARRVEAECSDRPLRQAMISTRQDPQNAVSSEYTQGAEMLGTPVTRLTHTMVDGATNTKTAQASSSSPPTARSSGSVQSRMIVGSLMARAAASTAAGIHQNEG